MNVKLSLVLALTIITATLSAANKIPRGWDTDINKAMARARNEKKNVLVLFTGSDWCTWCQRLRHDVLEKKEFEKVADKRFILVYFDFPFRDKKIKKAQMDLQQNWLKKLNVHGYPTTVILNGNGKKLTAIEGYLPLDKFIDAVTPPYRKKTE